MENLQNEQGRSGRSVRLAVYEIKWDDDVPVKVAINEASGTLRRNSVGKEVPAFVNGVLAKISRLRWRGGQS